MKKIVLLPLDERPCNAAFPGKLFAGEALQIITPPCLGSKKTPADYEALRSFLETACRDADGLVLSLDMLLYGGLLPSRLHNLPREVLRARLDWLRELKRRNPGLTVYGFQCIMRCPAYSSDDEEPDYYGQYGRQIHLCGSLSHRAQLGLCSREEAEAMEAAIPASALEDYRSRRALNLSMNKAALELVSQGILDFLVIPQDDSAPYGYTALDQQEVRSAIAAARLQTKVLMYPGADEVGLTLIARMLLKDREERPRVSLRYAAHNAPNVIPAYEDRTLGETVKAHLLAAGCRLWDNAETADFILALSCPGGKMEEAAAQPVRNAAYCVERSLTEFVWELADWVKAGKRVVLCDNAYANGADLELLDQLDQLGILGRFSGYAGWNTSSNSMGTAIAQGVYSLLCGTTPQLMDFLALRYTEDAGYCAWVRSSITQNLLPGLGMDYFDIKDRQGPVSREAHKLLQQFIAQRLPGIAAHIVIDDVAMPWRRMFEADISARWI